MTEEKMKRRLYDLYQLDWMITHGYSLADIMQGMNNIPWYHDRNIADYYPEGEDSEPEGMRVDVKGIFNDWEFNSDAFGGECWVCFDEFCNAELTDIGYIKALLDRVPSEEGLRDAYNKWLEENGSEVQV